MEDRNYGLTVDSAINLTEWLDFFDRGEMLIQSRLTVYRIILRTTEYSMSWHRPATPDDIYYEPEDDKSGPLQRFYHHDIGIMGGWAAATDYCKHLCQSLSAEAEARAVKEKANTYTRYELHGISIKYEAMPMVSPDQIREIRKRAETFKASVTPEAIEAATLWARFYSDAEAKLKETRKVTNASYSRSDVENLALELLTEYFHLHGEFSANPERTEKIAKEIGPEAQKKVKDYIKALQVFEENRIANAQIKNTAATTDKTTRKQVALLRKSTEDTQNKN